MSKAEDLAEKALKVYPKMSRISEPHGVIPADNNSHYLGDGNEEKREGFIVGYRQAEKDLELTGDDMHAIAIIEDKLIHELCLNDQELPNTQEFYEEVLKRFKETRNERPV